MSTELEIKPPKVPELLKTEASLQSKKGFFAKLFSHSSKTEEIEHMLDDIPTTEASTQINKQHLKSQRVTQKKDSTANVDYDALRETLGVSSTKEKKRLSVDEFHELLRQDADKSAEDHSLLYDKEQHDFELHDVDGSSVLHDEKSDTIHESTLEIPTPSLDDLAQAHVDDGARIEQHPIYADKDHEIHTAQSLPHEAVDSDSVSEFDKHTSEHLNLDSKEQHSISDNITSSKSSSSDSQVISDSILALNEQERQESEFGALKGMEAIHFSEDPDVIEEAKEDIRQNIDENATEDTNKSSSWALDSEQDLSVEVDKKQTPQEQDVSFDTNLESTENELETRNTNLEPTADSQSSDVSSDVLEQEMNSSSWTRDEGTSYMHFDEKKSISPWACEDVDSVMLHVGSQTPSSQVAQVADEQSFFSDDFVSQENGLANDEKQVVKDDEPIMQPSLDSVVQSPYSYSKPTSFQSKNISRVEQPTSLEAETEIETETETEVVSKDILASTERLETELERDAKKPLPREKELVVRHTDDEYLPEDVNDYPTYTVNSKQKQMQELTPVPITEQDGQLILETLNQIEQTCKSKFEQKELELHEYEDAVHRSFVDWLHVQNDSIKEKKLLYDKEFVKNRDWLYNAGDSVAHMLVGKVNESSIKEHKRQELLKKVRETELLINELDDGTIDKDLEQEEEHLYATLVDEEKSFDDVPSTDTTTVSDDVPSYISSFSKEIDDLLMKAQDQIYQGRLEDAKRTYNKVRELHLSAEHSPDVKKTTYERIRELYDAIKLRAMEEEAKKVVEQV